jgi:two-component system sensor histidine kinase YesM
MVESLSKLFRIGLSGGRELIALSDEIEHIKSYLTIQRIRYRDKLNFSIDFPEHLLQLRVLKLILQPVVENAIYHGIKERRGPGHIHLSAAIDGDQLQLIVKDDGKGMDEDALKKLQYKLDKQYANADPVESESDKGGYGLINVQARLKLTYGADYGIQVSSQPGLGTVVTIVQPVMKPYEQLEKKGDDHA